MPRGKLYFDKYKGKKKLVDNQKNKSTSFYCVIVCYKVIDKNYFIQFNLYNLINLIIY